jgi:hypothetical protein
LLFESPLWLIPCLVVAQLVLIRIWSNRRTPGTRRAMLVGFGLFGVLVAVQALVVTDRERITAIVETLVEATKKGDLVGIAAHIAEQFEVEGYGRDEFLEGVRRILTHYHVENPIIRHLHITIGEGEAEARFGVICRIVTAEEMNPNTATAWTLAFAWIDGRWQVIRVGPRPTPVFPFRNLGDLMP